MSGSERIDGFYRAVRAVARFWLWFVFKAVTVRHPERVPRDGPVLLCINHPNNFIDSLVVGAAVRRKVHYLATAALFRNPLIARFLLTAGAIPVYRKQDDPDKMDKNADAFAACAAAFEGGALVAIYPEGTTHAEARVQRIKTGAARIALAWEAAHSRTLTLLPVGLTFEARKSFRARVLVSFGPPLPLHAYVDAYRDDPAKAVDALTRHVQDAMEAEVVNVERIDDARLLRSIEGLYRNVLARDVMEARGVGPREVDLVRLSRSIVEAIGWVKARERERGEAIWQRIRIYRPPGAGAGGGPAPRGLAGAGTGAGGGEAGRHARSGARAGCGGEAGGARRGGGARLGRVAGEEGVSASVRVAQAGAGAGVLSSLC